MGNPPPKPPPRLSERARMSQKPPRASLYTPLPDGDARAIRLIRLLPGLTPGIACELFETTLDRAKNRYRALSYTWHGPQDSQRAVVSCNGVTLRIGVNLYAALQRLRQRTRAVVLWVDSICINQADDAERTRQVGIMRDIFAGCSEVVVWLGIRDRDDDLGESVEEADEPDPQRDTWDGEDLGRRVRFSGDDGDLRKLDAYLRQISGGGRALAPHKRDVYGAFCAISMLAQGVAASKLFFLRHLDHSPPIMNGLKAILGKPWWRRIWVVQETVVAGNATVYYSDISIPWEAFSRAAARYEAERVSENSVSYLTYGGTLADFCRVITDIEATRRDWKRIEPLSLLPVLRKFRDRDASDRRDKVFALLGLVRHWGLGRPLVPDYRVRKELVFWQTTVRSIVATRSLAVLAGTLGVRPSPPDSSSPGAGLPSWIADWSCHPEANEYGRLNNMLLYDASGGVVDRVRIHGSSLLEAQGYFVDRVTYVAMDSDEASAASGLSGRRALQATVSEWSRSFEWSDNEEYQDGASLGDAFWRTICGDTLYELEEGEDEREAETTVGRERKLFRRADASGLRAYRDWRSVDSSDNRRTSVIAGTMQDGMGSEDNHHAKNKFHMAADLSSVGRKFFRTRKGYMGTGPKTLKNGDGVFVLIGSRVPMILRTSTFTQHCSGSKLDQLIVPDEEADVSRFFDPSKAPAAAVAVNGQQGGGAAAPLPDRLLSCSEDHLTCYKVVGDAYVHGIMDGQIVWEDREQKKRREAESLFLT